MLFTGGLRLDDVDDVECVAIERSTATARLWRGIGAERLGDDGAAEARRLDVLDCVEQS
jgi:hypothetical protein